MERVHAKKKHKKRLRVVRNGLVAAEWRTPPAPTAQDISARPEWDPRGLPIQMGEAWFPGRVRLNPFILCGRRARRDVCSPLSAPQPRRPQHRHMADRPREGEGWSGRMRNQFVFCLGVLP